MILERDLLQLEAFDSSVLRCIVKLYVTLGVSASLSHIPLYELIVCN